MREAVFHFLGSPRGELGVGGGCHCGVLGGGGGKVRLCTGLSQ